jgi:O-antigen ligase
MVLVIPATHSRGAWLAVIFSSLFLLESHYRYIKTAFNKVNQNKKIVLAVLTVCILSAGVLGIYHFKKGSADGRLFLWKVTTEIIKDFPVTGVGFDRFKTHYMNYQANYFAEHGETPEALAADNSYYAFNDWLQFVTEQGVIGLILISLLIYSIFKVKTNKEHSYFYKVIGASIGAISLFAIVSYPMQILPIKFIIVVLLASLASIDKDTYTYLWSRNNSNQYTAYVFKTILICFIVFGALKSYGFVKNLNNAFKIWKSALTEHQYGDYDSAERYFQKAYQTLNRDGDFLMNYGKAMTMNGNYLDAVQILEDTKVHLNTTIVETALGDAYKGLRRFDKAEIAYKNAYNMIPIRFYPLYLQAKLYEESGQKEKAVSIAKVILNKDIKVYSTAIKEIKVEMENILKTSGVKNASF